MASAAEIRSRPAAPWLYGPGTDLLLGCGIGYSVLLVAFLLFDAGSVVGAWMPVAAAFLAIAANTPHYGATLLRVYENAADRRKYVFFTVHVTIALTALMVAGMHWVWIGSALITLHFTWSPWHLAGQNYGIALMFARRRGVEVTPLAKRLFYASFLCSFLLVFLLAHGIFEGAGIQPSYQREVYTFLPLGIPKAVAQWGLVLVGIAYVGSTVGAAALMLRRARLGEVAPSLCLVVLQALWFGVPSAMIAMGDLRPGAFATTLIWVNIAHAIQYLWITSYYARRGDGAQGMPAYLLKALAWGSVATVFPVMLFAPTVLGPLPFHAGLAILVFAAVNLHHFMLDGAIWKLRDGRVAGVLIRSRPAAPERPEPIGTTGTPGATAGLGRRAVYVVGLLCCAVAFWGLVENRLQMRAIERGDLERAARSNERLAWIGRESHAVHQQLGMRYAKRKEWDLARRHLERSLAIHPSVEAWQTLGRVHSETGELRAARDALEAALALSPEHLASLRLLAEVSTDLGDPVRARELLEHAATLAPANHAIRSALVRARREESLLEASTGL